MSKRYIFILEPTKRNCQNAKYEPAETSEAFSAFISRGVCEPPCLLRVTKILSILTSYSEGLHNGHPARSSLVPKANVGIIHQTESRSLLHARLPDHCRMFFYIVQRTPGMETVTVRPFFRL